jgi:hypothetical protein
MYVLDHRFGFDFWYEGWWVSKFLLEGVTVWPSRTGWSQVLHVWKRENCDLVHEPLVNELHALLFLLLLDCGKWSKKNGDGGWRLLEAVASCGSGWTWPMWASLAWNGWAYWIGLVGLNLYARIRTRLSNWWTASSAWTPWNELIDWAK